MPRDGSNVYSLPPSVTAAPGDTVQSAKWNSALGDLAADNNTLRPISAGGTGASSAAAALANLGAAPLASPAFTGGIGVTGNAAVTGNVSVTGSLTAAGNAVWHAGNFNPALRQRIVSAPTALTNNATIPNAESGLTYSMNLAGGVQIVNLPATTGLADGFSCVVVADGAPSGFQTASVRAETGKTVSYRSNAIRDFFLVGNGEVFRFTWLVALDTWVAECLRQPSTLPLMRRTHSNAAWNSSPTAWFPLNAFTNTNVALSPQIRLGTGDAFEVATAGIYQVTGSCTFSAGAGGGVTGTGFLAGGSGAGIDLYEGHVFHQYNVSDSDNGQLCLSYAITLNANATSAVLIVSSTSFLRIFLSSILSQIRMISR